MRVPVRLFARYREAAGRDRVEVEVPDGSTVEDVWKAVAAAYPVLRPYRPHTLFAAGNDFVGPEQTVEPGQEIACLPPASGGA
jgi:molybdopterin converting factor small subunit